MLIRYSRNPIQQFKGIFWFNRGAVLFFLIWSALVYTLHHQYSIAMDIPVIPVTILGGALAIFLGFRNNSAYDRWWEARKIWGAIVNTSRHIGTQIIAYVDDKEDQNRMVYRHIGWVHALNMHLRKNMDLGQLQPYLKDDLLKLLESARNVPVQILHRQGCEFTIAMRKGQITEFQHNMLMQNIYDLYTHQGQAERIKNTIFPFYYNYFTRIFLWLFIILLPCALVESMNWLIIPISVAINFIFYILNKSGEVTEDPFENRAADIPMTTLTRTIEIDLLQQIEAEDIPESFSPLRTSYDAEYQL
ncbi:MAG: bestrophin [Flavobacteriales bacterium]|nr:bestrophin [Flavobacteriales bacterium]